MVFIWGCCAIDRAFQLISLSFASYFFFPVEFVRVCILGVFFFVVSSFSKVYLSLGARLSSLGSGWVLRVWCVALFFFSGRFFRLAIRACVWLMLSGLGRIGLVRFCRSSGRFF